MRLATIYLRYRPPGIVLEFETGGQNICEEVCLDYLLTKNKNSIVENIASRYTCITNECRRRLHNALSQIESKLTSKFYKTGTEFPHILPITNIAITKDGDRILTGCYDRTAKIWSTKSGQVIVEMVGHSDVVCHVEFNQNGNQALTCSFDKTIRLWDCNTGTTLCRYWGHNKEVLRTRYFNNEETIISASLDNTLKIFQVDTGQEKSTLLGHTDNITTFDVDESESFIISGSFDNSLKLWDPRTGSCMQTFPGHKAEISKCQILRNNFIASTSFDNTCKIWDTRKAMCIHTFVGHTKEVVDMSYSTARGTIVTGGNDGKAIIWNCHNFQKLGELSCNGKPITMVKYSPVKQRILTCAKDKSVRIWDDSKYKCIDLLQHNCDITYADYNSKENKIVTCSIEKCFLWQCFME